MECNVEAETTSEFDIRHINDGDPKFLVVD